MMAEMISYALYALAFVTCGILLTLVVELLFNLAYKVFPRFRKRVDLFFESLPNLDELENQ